MNSHTEPTTGKNLTGAMMSPKEAEKTKEGAKALTVFQTTNEDNIASNRILYINEAEALGSIPQAKKKQAQNEVLMDKLSERAAFERTGTRLYEALLTKYLASDENDKLKLLVILEKFHQEEMDHFNLVNEVIFSLGGDPTAMSPCADIAGTAAFGWMQVLTDPRTSFKQCLEIILQAELVDNASWEMLIAIADELNLPEISQKFKNALEEENFHLKTIKQWVNDLMMNKKANLLS